MQDYGLVSIITPNWNCANLILETIRSVKAQTYPNWEIIIVDDCSTDNSNKVVESYMAEDGRIRFLKNDKNFGAALSRNYALREAKGRWIAFLDSDDLWEPKKLDDGRETGVVIRGPKHVSKLGMFAFCWPGCLTVMYDREVVGLIQIADIKKNNDYTMWLKICQKADCYRLDEVLAKYRRGRVGSISTHGYSTMVKWHYKLWHKAMGKNFLASLFWTCTNLVCGVYKKLFYVKKISK